MKKITPRGNKNISGYVRNANGHYVPIAKYIDMYGDGLEKVITDFNLDLSDLPYATETRNMVIVGDSGAEFILEIKNEDGHYYNFITNEFGEEKAVLEEILVNGSYETNIIFPTVTDDDQYDVYLLAKEGTRHVPYVEERFDDGSLDINNSTGSNSLLMQKVIYQYAILTLTITGYSVGGTVGATFTPDTSLTISRHKNVGPTAFSIPIAAAGTAAYRILRQPTADDVTAFVQPVVGSAPITLPGEDIYPSRRAVFTGDDINGAITSGSVVRMDAVDLSAVIEVGDRITTDVMTDTVNGDFSGGATAITMDSAVATKMAVGDQVTGNAALNAGVFTVASIDSTYVFSLNASAAIDDGVTLSFSSKINRSITTVTVVETSGTATDFTMSQAIQFRDNAPLYFWPQMNYGWPINNYANIMKEGMVVLRGTSSNIVAGTGIGKYQDKTEVGAGTKHRRMFVSTQKPGVSTVGKTPTVVKGLVTVQEGEIIFDKQQPLVLAGDTLKIGGYGENEVLRVFDWEIILSNLAITLTPPTTTTTESITGNATIAVADREGVINNISRVGGIGIDSSVQNPLITSGGGADGAGDWTMDAVQTLENGITLTVENTSRLATLTGDIEIIRAGTASKTLRFDIDELLSLS